MSDLPHIELPASITALMAWMRDLPPDAQIEATVYNSYTKGAGKSKIQRLVAHCEEQN